MTGHRRPWRYNPRDESLGGYPAVSRRLPRTFWRYLKATVIFLIVTLHLLFLVIRNPLDLWDEHIKNWLVSQKVWQDDPPTDEQKDAHFNIRPAYRFVDELTYRFAQTTGTEQRWVMFTPPMARRAPFLGVRLEFADGSRVVVPSDNEPRDPTDFLRIGNWQVRKLEDVIYDIPATRGEANPEWPMWEAYVRWRVRHWKNTYENTDHEPVRVVLIKRVIYFPGPFEAPNRYSYGEEEDLLSFTPQGKLFP